MGTWSKESAVELGRRALASLGLEGARLRLLKFGAIANFRVVNPDRFLKVADPGFRSAEPVLARSLAVSAWLDDHGFPVADAAEEGEARPVAVDGTWAGLWAWQDQVEERPGAEATGGLLRRLHELLASCPVELPEVDHLEAARRHIVALSEKGQVDHASVEFLLDRAERLESDWASFGSELGLGAIHGDFEIDNVLVTPRGPLLIDLDNAQVAPREWDLIKAAPGSPSGWRPEEWPEFARAYGHDVLATPAGDVLRDVRRVRSLVWMLGDPRFGDRFARGRRLLEEWVAASDKRCFELDWR